MNDLMTINLVGQGVLDVSKQKRIFLRKIGISVILVYKIWGNVSAFVFLSSNVSNAGLGYANAVANMSALEITAPFFALAFGVSLTLLSFQKIYVRFKSFDKYGSIAFVIGLYILSGVITIPFLGLLSIFGMFSFQSGGLSNLVALLPWVVLLVWVWLYKGWNK